MEDNRGAGEWEMDEWADQMFFALPFTWWLLNHRGTCCE